MKGKPTKIFTGTIVAATVVALPAFAIAANAQSQQPILGQQPTSRVQQPNKGKEEVKQANLAFPLGKKLSSGVDRVAKQGETLYSRVQQSNKGKEEVKRGKILSYGVDHVAKQGETLYSIAVKYYGDKSRWKDIYEATKVKSRINGGPDRDFDPANLPVGMVIYVPYPTQGI
jgi:nucleoid-associated protein YgaU